MLEVRAETQDPELLGNPFRPEKFARDITFFVAREDGKAIGQLALVRKGTRWWLDYLYVLPEARGHGVVRELVRPAFAAAALVTPYVFENCRGVRPEDLERNNDRYGLRLDVLNVLPQYTLVRRWVRPAPEAPDRTAP